jgi:hypothetical protein
MDLCRAVIVSSSLHHFPADETLGWIERTFSKDRRHFPAWPVDCECYRNRCLWEYGRNAPLGIDWLVSIDPDVLVVPSGIWGFSALDADLCCCRSEDQGDWSDPREFHCTLFAIRLKLLRRLSFPVVRFGRSANGCQITACECRSLRDAVLKAGGTVAHGGFCVNTGERSWCH